MSNPISSKGAHWRALAVLMTLLGWVSIAQGGEDATAKNVYQSPEAFIAEAFPREEAQQKVLWVDEEIRARGSAILDRKMKGLRIRYWTEGMRTVWILDEVGRDHPITTGVIVNDGKVETIRVLIFRESRGWEVKHPFFTDQFEGAAMEPGDSLDRSIDGITGATLSARALKRQARLALMLDEYADKS